MIYIVLAENSEPFLARFPDTRIDGGSRVTSAFDGCVCFRACLPQLLGTNQIQKHTFGNPSPTSHFLQTLFPTTHPPVLWLRNSRSYNMTTGTKRRASDEGAEPPPPPPAHRPLKYGIGCDRNGQDLLYFCGQGCLEISFMRTLRVSDNEETSELPPGFGRFPLHHVKDYAENFSSEEGFFLPMYRESHSFLRKWPMGNQ